MATGSIFCTVGIQNGSTESFFEIAGAYDGVTLSNTQLGFVEDVRSPSIVPKRQVKKAAREFTAAASDDRYREVFDNIRLLRDRFETEAGRHEHVNQ